MYLNVEINYCLNLSFDDLQKYAAENYQKVYRHISSTYEKEKATTLLISSLFTCIASDRNFSDLEWKFISRFVGGYTYEEALDMANQFCCKEAQNITSDLAKIFPSNIRDAFVCFCIAVLAVDKRLENTEINFLGKLLDN